MAATAQTSQTQQNNIKKKRVDGELVGPVDSLHYD